MYFVTSLMNAQARAFVFTWNYPYSLPTEHDFPTCSHLVYQEEMAPTTGMPHLQGYVKFPKRKRASQVKDLFKAFSADEGNHVHLEVARGSPEQNAEYCTKEESRIDPATPPYKYGDFSEAGQGKRNDIIALRDAIKTGRNFAQLVDDDTIAPSVAAHMRFTERCMKEFQQPPPRGDVRVRFCYGPSGYGKTHCATRVPTDLTPDDIYMKDGGEFWEGYTGQPIVVMDEFGGHTLPPLTFQRVCDKFPMRVNQKGGSSPLLATDIRITSNYLPSQWWKEGTRYTQEAIFRRIHEVHHHDGIRSYTLYRTTPAEETEDGKAIYAMDKFLRANACLH